MSRSRSPGRLEDSSYPDSPDRHSHANNEQPTPGQINSPLPEDENQDHAREVSSWKRLPWWKKPSPYWVILGAPLSSMGYSALLAPKVTMYTDLVCRVRRPEYITNSYSLHSILSPPGPTIDAVDATILNASSGSENATNMASIFLPYPTYGPIPGQECASDPVVQADVARLNAVFSVSMGILSCLTTGWWGSLSDRYGRRFALFASLFGLLVTDITHVITAWFVDVVPGGYWFPLIGYLIEGLCGAMPTGIAASHAYLADTTDPSTRSRYFSLSLGFMFTGVAVGPILGGLLIRSTGTILSVFYLASVIHGVYIILIPFFLPESLTRARARGTRVRRRQERASQLSSAISLGVLKNITRFLTPLVVLLPERPLDGNPLKRTKRDWSLFCIAIAYGLITSILGSYPYKFQYVAAQFNWTPETTSYYISFIGATRACFLAVVLPLIIKMSKPTPIQLPSTPNEPLRAADLPPSRGVSSPPGLTQINNALGRPPMSRSVFDLALARVSVGLEIVSYLSMAAAGTGTLFTLANTISSLGAGFSPVAQALALDIYASRRSPDRGEVGRLFGGLSVIQALGSQIISPAVYGFVYFNTAATFPPAIMVVSTCTSFLAFVFLAFVRVPSQRVGHEDEERSQDLAVTEILAEMEHEVLEG